MKTIHEQRNELLPSAIAKGGHEKYTAWIQKQRSCVSRRFGIWVDGEGRCEAAHVRRAAWSGTAHKGDWCLIPLTPDEHRLQHQKGESAIASPKFFEEQMIIYLIKWIAS